MEYSETKNLNLISWVFTRACFAFGLGMLLLTVVSFFMPEPLNPISKIETKSLKSFAQSLPLAVAPLVKEVKEVKDSLMAVLGVESPEVADTSAQSSAVSETPSSEISQNADVVGEEGAPALDQIAEAMPLALHQESLSELPKNEAKGEESRSPSASEPLQGMYNPQAYLNQLSGANSVGLSGANSVGISNTLSESDLALLNIPLKGEFNDHVAQVNGVLCPAGVPLPECSSALTMSVHTNRWTLNEGLAVETPFAINAPSISSVTVTIQVKLQALDGNFQSYMQTVSPISVQVENSVQGGHPIRTIIFGFSDITIRPDDVLKQVKVRMVYDLNDSSNILVLGQSMLEFKRNQVQTTSAVWASQVPAIDANTTETFLATEIPYSMNIEKLQ